MAKLHEIPNYTYLILSFHIGVSLMMIAPFHCHFQLVMEKNNKGYTALHYTCKNEASTKVIMELGRGHDSIDEQVKQTVDSAIKATAISQQCSRTHIAIKYGLRWSIHTKELAESNVVEVVNSFDGSTGLRLFMVAAMDNGAGFCDLSSIFGLMRMSPM